MSNSDSSSSPPSNSLEGYMEWATDTLGVIVHHPLRVGSMPGKDERGVFCEQNVPAESIVVSIPWEVGRVLHTGGTVELPFHCQMSCSVPCLNV